MRIKSAAVRWAYANETTPHITTGHSHSHCYEALTCCEVYENKRNPDVEQEGFVTDTGEFVDRYKAYQIAKEAGQLISESPSETLKAYNVRY